MTVSANPPGAPAEAGLPAYARSLAPALGARTRPESVRQLPAATVRDLRAAGFLRALQPRRHGGLELSFPEFADTALELGAACASTGWAFVILNSAWLLAGFPEQAQEDVWSDDPGAVVGSVLAPSPHVRAVEGGYRVSGRWPFASGIVHADWEIVGGLDLGGGAPGVRLFLLPRADLATDDDWDSIGLRATGSATATADDVFVPAHRSAPLAAFRRGREDAAEPLYRLPLGAFFPPSLAAPVVGSARAACEEWRRWSERRTTRGGSQRAATEVPVQIRLAEAAAEIDAAALLLRRDVEEAWSAALAGETWSEWQRARGRRDGAYAVELCVRAIDRLFAASGGRAVADAGGIQRAWRDVHTAAGHIAFRWDEAATAYGRVELGLGFDNPFFD
jgi:3-hydroxy-9,10-secoandrosta-1,3,5(10)-triene-9,17-dione monooxygenase